MDIVKESKQMETEFERNLNECSELMEEYWKYVLKVVKSSKNTNAIYFYSPKTFKRKRKALEAISCGNYSLRQEVLGKPSNFVEEMLSKSLPIEKEGARCLNYIETESFSENETRINSSSEIVDDDSEEDNILKETVKLDESTLSQISHKDFPSNGEEKNEASGKSSIVESHTPTNLSLNKESHINNNENIINKSRVHLSPKTSSEYWIKQFLGNAALTNNSDKQEEMNNNIQISLEKNATDVDRKADDEKQEETGSNTCTSTANRQKSVKNSENSNTPKVHTFQMPSGSKSVVNNKPYKNRKCSPLTGIPHFLRNNTPRSEPSGCNKIVLNNKPFQKRMCTPHIDKRYLLRNKSSVSTPSGRNISVVNSKRLENRRCTPPFGRLYLLRNANYTIPRTITRNIQKKKTEDKGRSKQKDGGTKEPIKTKPEAKIIKIQKNGPYPGNWKVGTIKAAEREKKLQQLAKIKKQNEEKERKEKMAVELQNKKQINQQRVQEGKEGTLQGNSASMATLEAQTKLCNSQKETSQKTEKVPVVDSTDEDIDSDSMKKIPTWVNDSLNQLFEIQSCIHESLISSLFVCPKPDLKDIFGRDGGLRTRTSSAIWEITPLS